MVFGATPETVSQMEPSLLLREFHQLLQFLLLFFEQVKNGYV